MASQALKNFSTTSTSQTEKAKSTQVKNNAGGFVFSITPQQRLLRFLTMGTDGGTYYVGQQKLTRDNAQFIIDHADSHGLEFVDLITEVSEAGRAPKNSFAIFALAILAKYGNSEVKAAAAGNISRVCRTPTMLIEFINYCKSLELNIGSSVMKRGLQAWYAKPSSSLEYSFAKYRQRDGWTQKDLRRVVHPKPTDNATSDLFARIIGKDNPGSNTTFPILDAVDRLNNPQITAKEAVAIIKSENISWDMLPTTLHNNSDVWEALILEDKLPLGAMIRQLGRLTNLSLLTPLTKTSNVVLSRLSDVNRIKKSRIHPLVALEAMAAYKEGSGKSGSTWRPESHIVAALENLFYLCYDNVESTGRATLVGLDVSDSMTWESEGTSHLTPAQIGAALSLLIINKEKNSHCMGFAGQFIDLGFTKNTRLKSALRKTDRMDFGRTDCAQPMIYAMDNDLEVETFIVITDNETWAGNIHPHEALNRYRKKTGIDAKLIVLACTPTNFSIADPDDPGMLDISGYDSSIPQTIADFSAGNL